MIHTKRLILREFQQSDRQGFAQLNRDTRVMEYFPRVFTEDESNASFDRILSHWKEKGFGYWAVEVPGILPFAGMLGLSTPRFEAHFTPCVEIGWRLAVDCWGKGYATEGAQASLEYGFEKLEINEVVAMTPLINHRSRRVMEKLGMTFSPDDHFDHPLVPLHLPITRHALYRISRHSVSEGAPEQ